MNQYTKRTKRIAGLLMIILAAEWCNPKLSFALTTGPTQPEVQGFEPVGTSDMVDMFSGDFVYNIPLLDVDGYPINLSYHSGSGMETESSWCGFGFSINPGTINRTVRGLPDDFNGDTVMRDFTMRPEENIRIGIRADIKPELGGVGDPGIGKKNKDWLSLSAGFAVNVNNYKGQTLDFNFGASVNITKWASAGVDLGVGTTSGATIDYSASFATPQKLSKSFSSDGGASFGVGGGYNSRTGIKDLSFGMSLTQHGRMIQSAIGFAGGTIPIGTRNYVPMVTNSSTMSNIMGRLKLGGELSGLFLYGTISGAYSKITYENDASRLGYGYLYLQNAPDDNSLLDFTRDKDGSVNRNMQYLPLPHLTYDLYNVSGQGTGGMFRPFRNDFGSVNDPVTDNGGHSISGGLEGAICCDLWEGGYDGTASVTHSSSGPWVDYSRNGKPGKGYTKWQVGSTYEPVYFKSAGDLSAVDSTYYEQLGKQNVLKPGEARNLPSTKNGATSHRDSRSNLFYYRTSEQDSTTGVSIEGKQIRSYDIGFSSSGTSTFTTIDRVGNGNSFSRKKDQLSEIIQVQKDGKRYVYGIGALNSFQKEATFSVNPRLSENTADLSTGLVQVTTTDQSLGNTKSTDKYYNATVTPSYVHSYLLTSVLSPDYVDVTGDGISDDDLGDFTHFSYSRTDSDYRWVSPYDAAGSMGLAHYNPGFWSDKKDDKATIMSGSREQWYLHAVEGKNFVAEFYISPRDDGKGITKKLDALSRYAPFDHDKASGTQSLSYKLDSIRLFNKHDRRLNGATAVPVKTVYFVYSYELCPGIRNGSSGKLTLKKLYFKYGNSQRSMISPYQFGYGINPGYSVVDKDRWGNFKHSSSTISNYEFPYVDQRANNDSLAGAWALNRITLPSGGVIQATYESDDYAFVQNRCAAEMTLIDGIGNSKEFSNGNFLYNDKSSPNLYLYFKRQMSKELGSLSFAENYMGTKFVSGGTNVTYFNFNIRLTDKESTYEQIKGYANVQEIGICPHNSDYGYLKLAQVNVGSNGYANPICYTAINTSRYHIPGVIYDEDDPDLSSLRAVLKQVADNYLKFKELFQNPINGLMGKSCARVVNLQKSSIRLQSVGLRKDGGGQRVKSLTFTDQWRTMSGGPSQDAQYGKTYDYTISDPLYGQISSGVASYEPSIGGDENPFREPVPYEAQAGSTFPPNEPIDLYQELPVGESLWPPEQVGYSNVTVRSIHADVGRSSQDLDTYQFYTAKDFPVIWSASGKTNEGEKPSFGLFEQTNNYSTTQGYVLQFNDMHGKPKRVEHGLLVMPGNTYQCLSYTQYNYRQKDGQLDNNVTCIVANGSNLVMRNRQLGVEMDVTMDNRRKEEVTSNTTSNGNLSCIYVFVPIAFPTIYPWTTQSKSLFTSAVVNKVIQRYGILDNIKQYSEGAVTSLKNEVYDASTGQAVVTSLTNEYGDKEYTTQIPAQWVYRAMGQGSANIGYRDTGRITVDTSRLGKLYVSNSSPLEIGDELLVHYVDVSGNKQITNAYVMGMVPQYTVETTIHTEPHIVYDTDTIHVPDVVSYYCFDSTHSIDITGYGIDSVPLLTDGTCLPTDFCTHTMGPITTQKLDREYHLDGHIKLPTTCVSGADSFFICTGHLINININLFLIPSFPISECSTSRTYDYTEVPSTLCMWVNPAAGTVRGVIGAASLTSTWSYAMDYLNPASNPCGIPVFRFIGGDMSAFSMRYDTIGYHDVYTVTSHPSTDPYTTYASHATCPGMTILPRFPLNTPGWDPGANLAGVEIEVLHSGRKNRLSEHVEQYTSSMSPVTASGVFASSLQQLSSLSATTYADSNTAIFWRYIVHADSVNPYTIGERGQWRPSAEYAYIAPRNYNSTIARNAGLFNATGLYSPVYGLPTFCYSSPYQYWSPHFTDANWHKVKTITKWSPSGNEIENMDAVGNYSSAIFGFNERLPVAVGYNIRQGDMLFESFEDYHSTLPITNIQYNRYSPLNDYNLDPDASSSYRTFGTSASGLAVNSSQAHTGKYSLKVPGTSDYAFNLPVNTTSYGVLLNHYNSYYRCDPLSPYPFRADNEYLPFKVVGGTEYILSYWMKSTTSPSVSDGYSIAIACGVDAGSTHYPPKKITNTVEGWQLVEIRFRASSSSNVVKLPGGFYVDDLRIYPASGNMKSFVYDPFTARQMAMLDENNYATFYEYDQEGSRIRLKRETSKGVMTISESRNGSPKN